MLSCVAAAQLGETFRLGVGDFAVVEDHAGMSVKLLGTEGGVAEVRGVYGMREEFVSLRDGESAPMFSAEVKAVTVGDGWVDFVVSSEAVGSAVGRVAFKPEMDVSALSVVGLIFFIAFVLATYFLFLSR